MGKYGKASLLALEQLRKSTTLNPQQSWELAVSKMFPDSPSAQAKGCPKGAFLGLCSEGLVKGVTSGKYTSSVANRRYAVTGVQLLQSNPSLAERPKELWAAIMQRESKVENSQTDVVIALWNAGALEAFNG